MPKLKSSTAGFGLIELMVSIGIVVMVMAIVMVKHNKSTSAVLLRSQAYEIALDTREVQLSAVSAIGITSNFRNVLGLYFDSTPSGQGHYSRFVDGDDDFFYDSSEEFYPRGAIDPRFVIGEIRLVVGAAETAVDDVSIVFERPNFDALFYTSSGNTNPNVSAVEIDVRVVGADAGDNSVGAVRTVEITRTGQIIVQ